MKTVQPSRFNNRIYLKEKLTKGLKIKSLEAGNNYTIEGTDLKESTEDYYCYIIQEVWNYRELFKDTEYQIVGYKPEKEIEIKETVRTEEEKVDLYFEELKENLKLEKQYRDYLKSNDFDPKLYSGFWAKDRGVFKI